MAKTKGLAFRINFTGFVELTPEDIWPDGDAPEEPTAIDVEEAISELGGIAQVLWDWGLSEDLECQVEETTTKD